MSVDSNGETMKTLVLQAKAHIGPALDGRWRLEVVVGVVGGMAATHATSRRNGGRAAGKPRHAELSLNGHDCLVELPS